MKKTIRSILAMAAFGMSILAHAGEHPLLEKEYVNSEQIQTLLNTEFNQLDNPNCLNDYLSTNDFRLRLANGSKLIKLSIFIWFEPTRTQRPEIGFHLTFNKSGGENLTNYENVFCELK